MDFGDILDEWDRQRRSRRGVGDEDDPKEAAGGEMARWIDCYPPELMEQESGDADDRARRADLRRRLRAMAPEEVLDLHGSTAAEAQKLLRRFLHEAHGRGLRKVLIVHGKGLHSEGRNPVLKDAVLEVLRDSSLAGETGTPPRELGGSGGTWVILRHRSR